MVSDVTGTEIILVPAAPAARDHSGASGDDELIDMWIHRKASKHTQRAYQADVASLLAHLEGRPLRSISVRDAQAWMVSLRGADASIARRVSAIRSLFTFGHKTGYLQFNVGTVLEPPKLENHLAERILTEAEVGAMIKAARKDRLLISFLYFSGARLDEVRTARWKQVHVSVGGTSIVTFHGKGKKTRHLVLPASVAEELEKRRKEPEQYVFSSRTGSSLDPSNVDRMIVAVAARAGITKNVSAHWFRHSNASHALDRGCPVHVVQATLGHGSLATTGKYAHAKPTDSAGMYLDKELL